MIDQIAKRVRRVRKLAIKTFKTSPDFQNTALCNQGSKARTPIGRAMFYSKLHDFPLALSMQLCELARYFLAFSVFF